MKFLDDLLKHLDSRLDPAACNAVGDRYRRSLSYQPVDRPPLVFYCPEPPLGLKPFSYREAFDDPAKMMFNQLLLRVAFGLEIGDDSPFAIRTDHGTIIIATLLGGNFKLKDDQYPWVEPLGSIERLERLAESDVPNLTGGIGGKVIEFLEFYREKLSRYPNCRQCIQIAVPDLQGPFDTTHELWGSEIYPYFYERADLIEKLLGLVARTMVAFYNKVKPLTHDRLDPECICQHGYMIPGRILIRNDSIINISATLYERHVRPYDEKVLTDLGGGSIHFCGNGQHQVDPLLAIRPLKGLDFGQPNLMDLDAIYRKCAVRKIPVTHVIVSPEELTAGTPITKFPTGVVFTCEVKTLAQARELGGIYYKGSTKCRR